MGSVLVSGSAGFIGGYLVRELLERGYDVTGIDNLSKYGRVAKSYDDHPSYKFVIGDARDVGLLTDLLISCDHFVAGAAMIAGSLTSTPTPTTSWRLTNGSWRLPATRQSRPTGLGLSRR